MTTLEVFLFKVKFISIFCFPYVYLVVLLPSLCTLDCLPRFAGTFFSILAEIWGMCTSLGIEVSHFFPLFGRPARREKLRLFSHHCCHKL